MSNAINLSDKGQKILAELIEREFHANTVPVADNDLDMVLVEVANKTGLQELAKEMMDIINYYKSK